MRARARGELQRLHRTDVRTPGLGCKLLHIMAGGWPSPSSASACDAQASKLGDRLADGVRASASAAGKLRQARLPTAAGDH